jgi:hypothetical protein
MLKICAPARDRELIAEGREADIRSASQAVTLDANQSRTDREENECGELLRDVHDIGFEPRINEPTVPVVGGLRSCEVAPAASDPRRMRATETCSRRPSLVSPDRPR